MSTKLLRAVIPRHLDDMIRERRQKKGDISDIVTAALELYFKQEDDDKE